MARVNYHLIAVVERSGNVVEYRTVSPGLSSLAGVTNPGQIHSHDCSSSSASCMIRYLTIDVGGYVCTKIIFAQ